jgi:hypothetical protein
VLSEILGVATDDDSNAAPLFGFEAVGLESVRLWVTGFQYFCLFGWTELPSHSELESEGLCLTPMLRTQTLEFPGHASMKVERLQPACFSWDSDLG